MLKLLLSLFLTMCLLHGYSQDSVNRAPKVCVTFGILQGGGSLIGADIEALVYKRIGLQAGAGFLGFGGGLNIHLKPEINSSFVSLTYWHQGADDLFVQSILGPTFVFRGKKWFTAQLGFGFTLDKGPQWPTDKKQPPAMFLYSIGAYFL